MRSRALLLGSCITTLFVLAHLIPLMLWAYNLQRADTLLKTGLVWPKPRMVDALPRVADTQALKRALEHLVAAERWRPEHAHAYRLAAQVYAAQANWQRAAAALERARASAPDNPLLAWEAGLIYEQIWKSGAQPAHGSEAASRDAVAAQAHARGAWSAAEFDAAQFTIQGDRALKQERYGEAHTWYERARLMDNAPDQSLRFRQAIAAVIATRRLPWSLEPTGGPVHAVIDMVQIEAKTLQWIKRDPAWKLQYGDPLAAHSLPTASVGVLWWSGTAVAVVDVPEAATYRITVRAQHTSPAPVELQLEHNGIALAQFALDRADMSWQELATITFLEAGPHVIGVRFLNDGSVNGLDRNAVLDWLRLDRDK